MLGHKIQKSKIICYHIAQNINLSLSLFFLIFQKLITGYRKPQNLLNFFLIDKYSIICFTQLFFLSFFNNQKTSGNFLCKASTLMKYICLVKTVLRPPRANAILSTKIHFTGITILFCRIH